MTTFSMRTETCFVCGTIREYAVVASTSSFGPPDLDMRPPEMMRSAWLAGLHCCPSCGYCAPNISLGAETTKQTVNSASYQEQLRDSTYPELAEGFRCWAMLKEAAGELQLAGWSILQAAWVCDDARLTELAIELRREAIRLFRRAQESGVAFAEGKATELAVCADLLRRTGQFEQAQETGQLALNQTLDPMMRELLQFQITLAQRHDMGGYRADHSPAPVGGMASHLSRGDPPGGTTPPVPTRVGTFDYVRFLVQWIVATGVGWFVSVSIVWLLEEGLLLFALGVLGIIVIGLITGTAQWWVLRQYTRRAGRWLVAAAAGAAAGAIIAAGFLSGALWTAYPLVTAYPLAIAETAALLVMSERRVLAALWLLVRFVAVTTVSLVGWFYITMKPTSIELPLPLASTLFVGLPSALAAGLYLGLVIMPKDKYFPRIQEAAPERT